VVKGHWNCLRLTDREGLEHLRVVVGRKRLEYTCAGVELIHQFRRKEVRIASKASAAAAGYALKIGLNRIGVGGLQPCPVESVPHAVVRVDSVVNLDDDQVSLSCCSTTGVRLLGNRTIEQFVEVCVPGSNTHFVQRQERTGVGVPTVSYKAQASFDETTSCGCAGSTVR